mmetsp:Transcript_57120/g.121412  ORF Transcript_57120/g.121412 Transcript_57120/m.121412 type:complete len:243 (-) Transcript_57120:440-1168(-)
MDVFGLDSGLVQSLIHQCHQGIHVWLDHVLKERPGKVDFQVALVGEEALQGEGGVLEHRELFHRFLEGSHQPCTSLGRKCDRLSTFRLNLLVDVSHQGVAEGVGAQLAIRAAEGFNLQVLTLGICSGSCELRNTERGLGVPNVHKEDCSCLFVGPQLLPDSLCVGCRQSGRVRQHVDHVRLPPQDVHGAPHGAQLCVRPAVRRSDRELEGLGGILSRLSHRLFACCVADQGAKQGGQDCGRL